MIVFRVMKLSNGDYMGRKLIVSGEGTFTTAVTFQSSDWESFSRKLKGQLDGKVSNHSPNAKTS